MKNFTNQAPYLWAFVILYLVGLNVAFGQGCPDVNLNFNYNFSSDCGYPTKIVFQNTSWGADVKSVNYRWWLNDSLISTQYGLGNDSLVLDSGVYRLWLATGSSTCKDSVFQIIYVSPKPKPAFTISANPACALSTVAFEDSSKRTWKYTSYDWDFGDGKSGSGELASHNYTSAGTYKVLLTVTNKFNCYDTISKFVTIKNSNSGPIQFYDPLGMAKTTVSWRRCINSQSDPDSFTQEFASPDSLYDYTAYFGDGQVATGDTLFPYPTGVLTHLYKKTGIYDFIFTAKDKSGCYKTFVGEVVNDRIAVAGIDGPPSGAQNGCAPHTVGFGNSSTNVSPQTTMTWDFGDGTIIDVDTSNLGDTIFHEYTESQCSTEVKLTVENECGVSVAKWAYVNIYDIDEARIGANKTFLCEPNKTVTLSVASDLNCVGSQRRFYWDYGDGTNSGWLNFGIPQNHTYPGKGDFNVMLIDSNECGSDTAHLTITIRDLPKSGFVINGGVDVGCVPFSVGFSDSSHGDSIQYNWDFGDGNSSTKKNPSHTYTNPGIYDVQLSVNNECGVDVYNKQVEVYDGPEAKIGWIPPGCFPYTVHYLNYSSNTSPYASYYWELGDGTTSTDANPPDKVFSSPGTYTVKLYVTDTCGVDSFIRDFTVYSYPVADFSASIECLGDSTNFNDNSTIPPLNGTISSYQWDFGDGGNSTNSDPDYLYGSSGNFNVTLITTSSYGCADTVVKNVSVKDAPVVDMIISPAKDVCFGDPIDFNENITLSSSNLDSLRWHFGDGSTDIQNNVTHQYASVGSYWVNLIAYNDLGCSGIDSEKVHIHANPVASFTPGLGCLGDSTSFTDNSVIGAGESIVSYEWDFDNDGIFDDTRKNPKYLFPATGPFTVVLKITSNFNCVDYDTQVVDIHPIPSSVVQATSRIGCINTPLVFKNLSSNADSFVYEFSDGSALLPLTVQSNVQHYFSSAGTFIVSLTAYNQFGCFNIDTEQVSIYPVPIADFSSPSYASCIPFPIQFTNNSIDADSFRWYINGVFASNAPTLPDTTLYVDGDSMIVKLVAYSKNGCAPDSMTHKYYTSKKTIAAFTPSVSKGCGPLSVKFNNNSQNTSTNIWDFGDGDTSTAVSPLHVFSANPTKDTFYVVRLNASSGCGDTTFDTITVYPDPVSDFVMDTTNGCGPLTVNFTNKSIPNDTGTINDMTFAWDFGNGNSSSNVNPSATFMASPVKDTFYTIELTAYSEHGCVAKSSQPVQVYPAPTVSFTTSDPAGCGPLNVIFTNTSDPHDTSDIDDMTFAWDLGNGVASSNKNAGTIYYASLIQDSIYHVKLIGYTDHGCVDSSLKDITVYPKPEVFFIADKDKGCGPLDVSFTNISDPKDTSSINDMTFSWNFGNSVLSSAQDTQVTFDPSSIQDTTYKVRLTGYSEHGCVDSASLNILVYPKPEAKFYQSITDSCGPLNVLFTNQSTPKDTGSINDMTFSWNFGNGITSGVRDTAIKYFASATQDTIYDIKLIAYSEHGCVDSTQSNVTIYPKPKVLFTQDKVDGCGPLAVKFTNQSDPHGGSINTMTFNWDFGNGTTSSKKDENVSFLAAATQDTIYNINLIGTTNHGCTDSFSSNVKVYPAPIADFTQDVNAGCGPLMVHFTNHSSPQDTGSINDMSFIWDLGNDSTSNDVNPAMTYFASNIKDTIYPVTLTAISEHGCKVNTANSVRVYPDPSVRFIQSNIDGCGPLKVKFDNLSDPKDTSTINDMSFVWNYGNGITSTRVDSTITYMASQTQDSFYNISLIGYSEHGCVDSFSRQVQVYPQPLADFIADKYDGCGPLPVQFTNLSDPKDTGNISMMTFDWNLGNGVKSGIQDPNTVYKASKTKDSIYTVSLTAFSEHGCKEQVTKKIQVYPDPVAYYTQSNTDSCGPLGVVFKNYSYPNDTGDISIMSFQWDFGNGVVSNSQDKKVYFKPSLTQDTIYDIKLYAFSEHGCLDSTGSTVKVYPKPTVAFKQNITDSCGPLVVKFTNISTPHDTGSINDMSFFWDFGNGYNSVKKDKSEMFKAAKTQDTVYYITLIGASEHGCKDTFSSTVKIYPDPVADFIQDKTDSCGPLKVKFTNKSHPNGKGGIKSMSFIWDFANGVTSTARDTSVDFYASKVRDTIYNVKLTAFSNHGCKDDASNPVTIYPKPKVYFTQSQQKGCGPLKVNFYNQSVPHDISTILDMTFFWDFGNGVVSTSRDTTVTFYASKTKDTTYTVTLYGYTQHGCSDTFQRTITVYPDPVAAFTQTDSIGCGEVTSQFKNYSIPNDTGSINDMSFVWNFGNGIVDTLKDKTVKFINNSSTNDTTFNIVLTAISEHGCRDEANSQVRVNSVPDVKFKTIPDEGCGEIEVTFKDQSKGIDKYVWVFEDGDSSTLKNPVHKFKNVTNGSRKFNVKLIGTSASGCVGDTFFSEIEVFPNPVAKFKPLPDTGCAPLLVNFNNISINGSSYLWSFGDGGSDNSVSPQHTFYTGSNDTTYDVHLYVYSQNNCKDSFMRSITVHAVPEANFTVSLDTACSPAQIIFSNHTTNADSYSWNFGDGNISKDESPAHTYQNGSVYNRIFQVALEAINKFGCADTVDRNIHIYPETVARFSVDKKEGCNPLEVDFTNSSVNSDSVQWNFGDGTVSFAKKPTHIFNGSPFRDTVYNVQLVAFSKNGCSDTISKPIKVYKVIEAKFNETDSGCADLVVDFVDSSRNAISWEWDFGDGFTSYDEHPTHTYTKQGTYSVTLIVSNDNGCRDTLERKKIVTVLNTPVASFEVDSLIRFYPDKTFKFWSTSDTTLSHSWDLSDGTKRSDFAFSHTFSDTGQFKVTLTVSNGQCDDEAVKILKIIYPGPIAGFYPDTIEGCIPFTVHFTDTSKYAKIWKWNFDDGYTSSERNPTHVFDYADTFTVVQRVENQFGVDFARKVIITHDAPYAGFIANPLVIYFPDATTDIQDISIKADKMWWFVDGQPYVTGRINEINFSEEGMHEITQIVQTKWGCADTFKTNIKVEGKGEIYVANAFTPNFEDTINNVFKPYGYGFLYDSRRNGTSGVAGGDGKQIVKDDYDFKIFNRWGQKVFETNDPEAGWDGTFNGKPCAIDVYVWEVKVKFVNGKNETLKGHVHLIR